jgi:RNA polymerase sigma-70 factor (ECF subfamily)
MNVTPLGKHRGVPAPAPAPSERAEPSRLPLSAEHLYRENHEFVWRNARRLGASDDWVDDAVHEVFLVATRRLAEFEGRSSARTWLFAITFRVVLRLRRDRARHVRHTERYLREQPPRLVDAVHESESAQLLRYLLGGMSEQHRLVLILAELEGFSSAAIAETLGIPAGTVDSRLRAARQQLSRMLERERARDERWNR